MNQSVESLNEVIVNAKSLRRYEDQTTKARKHRYERRKIRSAIRQGEWGADDAS